MSVKGQHAERCHKSEPHRWGHHQEMERGSEEAIRDRKTHEGGDGEANGGTPLKESNKRKQARRSQKDVGSQKGGAHERLNATQPPHRTTTQKCACAKRKSEEQDRREGETCADAMKRGDTRRAKNERKSAQDAAANRVMAMGGTEVPNHRCAHDKNRRGKRREGHTGKKRQERRKNCTYPGHAAIDLGHGGGSSRIQQGDTTPRGGHTQSDEGAAESSSGSGSGRGKPPTGSSSGNRVKELKPRTSSGGPSLKGVPPVRRRHRIHGSPQRMRTSPQWGARRLTAEMRGLPRARAVADAAGWGVGRSTGEGETRADNSNQSAVESSKVGDEARPPDPVGDGEVGGRGSRDSSGSTGGNTEEESTLEEGIGTPRC